MNKVHRIIYCEVTNTYAAVAESTSARGKRSRSGAVALAVVVACEARTAQRAAQRQLV